jgi:hypothetical protein
LYFKSLSTLPGKVLGRAEQGSTTF